MTQFDPWVNLPFTVARRRARRQARLERRRATVVVAFAAALLLVVLFSATDRTRQTPVTAAVGPKPIARRGVTAARGGLLA